MENKNSSFGLFNSYGSRDPGMQVPVTSSRNSVMSPYLNFDPAYIQPSPESQYIFPEGASHSRGRFELAFSQIGGSVMAGAFAGGVNGVATGMRDTGMAALGPAAKRTQLLNFVTKHGASSAQTLGVIALMYSVFGVVLSKSRGADDEINTLAASTMTGLLYKSSSGLKSCARGGAVGLGLSIAYVCTMKFDKVKQMAGIN